MIIIQNQLLTANSRQGKRSGQHKLHKKANTNPYYLTFKLRFLARECSLEFISPSCDQLPTGSKQSHCDCSILLTLASPSAGKRLLTLGLHFCSYNSNCRRALKLIPVSYLVSHVRVCFTREEQGLPLSRFPLFQGQLYFLGSLQQQWGLQGSARQEGKASPVLSGASSPLWSCQRSLARLHLFGLLRRNQSPLSGRLLCQVLL